MYVRCTVHEESWIFQVAIIGIMYELRVGLLQYSQ